MKYESYVSRYNKDLWGRIKTFILAKRTVELTWNDVLLLLRFDSAQLFLI